MNLSCMHFVEIKVPLFDNSQYKCDKVKLLINGNLVFLLYGAISEEKEGFMLLRSYAH